MLSYLLRLLALAVVSSLCIRFYYDGSSVFPRTFVGAWWIWIIVLLVAYAGYKSFLSFREIKSYRVSLAGVMAGFVGFLFVLSFVHFSFIPQITGGQIASGGFSLFGRSFFACFVPVALVLLWWSTGQRLVRYAKFETEISDDRMLAVFVPISLGFMVFATLLTIVGSLGWFNGWTTSLIVIALLAWSWREIGKAFKASFAPIATVETGVASRSWIDQINLKLITGEWAVIVAALVIAVGFINIVRPTPIGWDDLGVYMNYPKLMAMNSAIPEGVGFVPWQLLTAIGFLMNSAIQAFYINQIGGVLSFFAVFLALAGWLGNRRGYIAWPLVCAMLAVSMPMIIFQQARDMKLDTAVLFLSVTVLYTALHYIRNIFLPELREHGFVNLLSRKHLVWIAVIGLLTGFVFSVKITSLMLVLGLLGLFAYSFYGLFGLLGFFSLFVAVFTRMGLWSLLNISTLSESSVALIVSLGAGLLGILSLGFAMIRTKNIRAVSVAAWLGVFFATFFLPLVPWLAKNASEIEHFSLLRMVTGEPAGYKPDFSKIYSPEEIDKITANATDLAVDKSGQTANEDFGRYFGNEEGINNYLKLPFNRTFQKTQNGEFTEIGYIFLALFPLILIFLPSVRAWFVVAVLGSIALYFFYTLLPSMVPSGPVVVAAWFDPIVAASKALGQIFAGIMLPAGYLVILGMFAVGVLAVHFGFKPSENPKIQSDIELVKLLAVFSAIYGFVYLVSSYGVPWYGILLYFAIFALISIAGSYAAGSIRASDKERIGQVESSRIYGAVVLIVIIGIWVARSTVSDAVSHLANVEYPLYRMGTLSQEEALASYHPNYLPIVSALNIKDDSALVANLLGSASRQSLKAFLVSIQKNPVSIMEFVYLMQAVEASNLREVNPNLSALSELAIKKQAKSARLEAYRTILAPDKSIAAETPIYRIGTFLSYYIADNIHRYYEDSLLFNYRSYYADSDPDVVSERMRATGFKHLLLDVNASTIDVNPPYELTARFENLLLALRSKGFKIISTDNPCLQNALQESSTLSDDDYLIRAGVSYDSARLQDDGTYRYTSRYSKRLACYSHIAELVADGKVTDGSEYAYLVPYAQSVRENATWLGQIFEEARNGKINHYKASTEIERLTNLQSGWMALFEIVDKNGNSLPTTKAIIPETSASAEAGSGATPESASGARQ